MYSDPSALDDTEFLVTSPNRIEVFDAIRIVPRTRHELREMTDASRVTLSRILGDLEDRGWVERVDAEYAPTPKGAVIATEMAQLFANLEAISKIEGVLQWLPVNQFDFDLACLSDATVLSSTERNLTAAITHTATRVREASRVRNIATGVSSEVVEAYLHGATSSERSLETVLHSSVFGTIQEDATLRSQLQAMLESDHITVRQYDAEEPPVMLTICDDAVIMCGRSNPRSPPEGLETSNDRVRAWATAYFDEIRADTTRVDPGTFTP